MSLFDFFRRRPSSAQTAKERLQTLRQAPEARLQAAEPTLAAARATFPRTQVASDDVLDAYVLARTAYRIASGQARCLPDAPPLDSRGLRMEIWY